MNSEKLYPRFIANWHRRICALFALLALGQTLFAAQRIVDNLTTFTLPNGMTFLIYPRKTIPFFTGTIYVDAGSAEDEIGQTGLAHLLEHMAFKGTPWIGTRDWQAEKGILAEIEDTAQQIHAARTAKPRDNARITSLTLQLSELQKEEDKYVVSNEYDHIMTLAGGQDENASTDNDYTNYYVTLPSARLELWFMMESERMFYPAWRELYKERDVVAEERRLNHEDMPSGRLYEEFITTAFVAHPYHNPGIGWMSDIQNLTISKTDAFYRKWYVPENFIGILAGDIDPAQAREFAETYFGYATARKSPDKTKTVEPKQTGTRRIQAEVDAEPEMVMGWHRPTFPNRDTAVFETLEYLLVRNGRSARLYDRLVTRDELCESVEAFNTPGYKYPNLECIWLTPQSPHTCAQVEKVVLEEIDKLKKSPVGADELARTRNQIDANFLKQLESNSGLAIQLGQYYVATKNPAVLDDLRDDMKKVTAEDVQRVAKTYFTPEQMTVAELVKVATKAESSSTTATATKVKDEKTTASASPKRRSR